MIMWGAPYKWWPYNITKQLQGGFFIKQEATIINLHSLHMLVEKFTCTTSILPINNESQNLRNIMLVWYLVLRKMQLTCGWDSLYHIWPNMSVRRGNIWGINVQCIHKGDVLFSFSVYIQKGYLEKWSKDRCINKVLREGLEKHLTIDVLVSSNIHFHPILSYRDSLQRLPCPFLLGLH